MIRAALLAAALLASTGLTAQEITQNGMVAGAPMAHGTAVVSYTSATLAVGKATATVAVPGVLVGDLVFVSADGTAGISVGSVLNPIADVVSAGQVRITWNTPGLAAVSLGTVSLRFRWMRFPP
ncbi:hypothetical protein [Pseudoroseomonas cervicalis]|uniref:hypothetical protein n=1 Tax=Teichococcus cervicalis TaxID=204525 RepID=UPI002785BDC0|nr:hypothetical protein [Pseudoroseomonas cervicalis]MDQ1078003.1 hypothetical protein [Pseudoroseomonas cervicalis]